MQKTTKQKWGIGLGFLAALVYVLVPTDIMPDLMPAIGWIDDIVAVLLSIANALRLGSKIKQNKTKEDKAE